MQDYLFEDRMILTEERQREYGWDFEQEEDSNERAWFDRLDYLPAGEDDDSAGDTSLDY